MVIRVVSRDPHAPLGCRERTWPSPPFRYVRGHLVTFTSRTLGEEPVGDFARFSPPLRLLSHGLGWTLVESAESCQTRVCPITSIVLLYSEVSGSRRSRRCGRDQSRATLAIPTCLPTLTQAGLSESEVRRTNQRPAWSGRQPGRYATHERN